MLYGQQTKGFINVEPVGLELDPQKDARDIKGTFSFNFSVTPKKRNVNRGRRCSCLS